VSDQPIVVTIIFVLMRIDRDSAGWSALCLLNLDYQTSSKHPVLEKIIVVIAESSEPAYRQAGHGSDEN